jgi:hypothetical protein
MIPARTKWVYKGSHAVLVVDIITAVLNITMHEVLYNIKICVCIMCNDCSELKQLPANTSSSIGS